jgi:membrane protease YdiL (CAAX protease family)
MNNQHTDSGQGRVPDHRLTTAVKLMLIYAAIQILSFAGMGVVAGFANWSASEYISASTTLMLFEHALCLFIIWHVFHADIRIIPADIGIRASEARYLYTVILIVLFAIIARRFHALYDGWMYDGQQGVTDWLELLPDKSAVVRGIAIITLGFSGPLIEELIFRGYLQSALMDRLPAAVAVCCSAFVFAAYHLDILGFPYQFACGVMLGTLYHVTRSLWPPLVLHMVINMESVTSVFYR